MPEKKIKTRILQKFWFAFTRFFNFLFVFLSIRKSRKFWGVVYDSVTKQPLDPVIIKLSYVQGGDPVQTCVTDLAGRYGFLARPGKFKIFAKKSNYSFPSKRIWGDNDGIFTDVYKGEFFELFSESEVVAPNIPMDPENFDWNQQAKLKVINTYPFLRLLIRKVTWVLFWFGFIFALIFVMNDFFLNYTIKFSGWPQYVLGIYILLMFLNTTVPQQRLWGKLVDKKSKNPLADVELKLVNPAIPTIILAKARTQDDGRFLLRANPGEYILQVLQHADIKVRVHGEGVVNLDLLSCG